MDDIQQQVNEEEIATFYNKVEEIWAQLHKSVAI